MKLTSLEIRNIGIIEDMTVPIDRPMLAFYGQVMQGKTTILNAVRLLFGGGYPDDLLRRGTTDGHVQLSWQGGCLRREFYVGRDGETKARPIAYIVDGKPTRNPVEQIKGLLNPFLLDQDHLIRMNERQRADFLVQLLGVDTSDIDAQLEAAEDVARDLRVTIKAFGEIDLEPVDPPRDEQQIRAERAGARQAWAAAKAEVQQHNKAADAQRAERQALLKRLDALASEEFDLVQRLEQIKAQRADLNEQLASAPEPPEHMPVPSEPDLSAYGEQLADARAQAVRYQAYLECLQRATQREEQRGKLQATTREISELRAARAARLTAANDACPVPGLAFDGDGSLRYEGTAMGMLSHSQTMRLSSAISDLYPRGLGLELLDRGESLGSSIWSVVERAKAEEKTILATVVGERPATVPEDVGVFVVEQGRLRADQEPEAEEVAA